MKKLSKVVFIESVQTYHGFQETLGDKYKVDEMELTSGGALLRETDRATKESREIFVPHANIRFCVVASEEK